MKEYLSIFEKDIFDMNFTEFMAFSFGSLVFCFLFFLLLCLILKIFFFFDDLNDMRKEYLEKKEKN